MSIGQIREDLKRLAKLAANVSDAYTCSIFLPTGLLTSPHRSSDTSTVVPLSLPLTAANPADTLDPKKVMHLTPDLAIGSIEMVAVHTSSSCLARDCRIQVGNGLLGWVAENCRSIHVDPFDMDSSGLGIYTESEPLKSLVAVPIPMPTDNANNRPFSGVLMCDSRKTVSFTKPQVKHLEELATLISRLLYWTTFKRETTSTENSWDSFLTKTNALSEAIGFDSIELVRITVESFRDLESEHGISLAVQQSEQFVRLIQQALPPHFPLVRLPNGDILLALDNMMTTFFQNKIRTLANHLNEQVKPFIIRIQNFSAKACRLRGFNIDTILRAIPASTTTTVGKVVGGSRA
jgi:hypothetical protein